MTILVTGGAGYIGSFTVRALIAKGHRPVIFDNLSTGDKRSVPAGITLVEGDLQSDFQLLKNTITNEQVEAVIHFAASAAVGDSVINPETYFYNNVYGTLNLLKAMRENEVKKLVFSSSAAVFGEPAKVPIEEDDPREPTNPYGETKLMMEKIMKWYCPAYGFATIAFRYFNACGAALDGSIGEADYSGNFHLILRACKAAMGESTFKINGNDYRTPDGTCLRDYIHVLDLADTHVIAVEALLSGQKSGFSAYNLGIGQGYSVLEVVNMVKQVSGVNFDSPVGPRRPGDPERLVASSAKFQKEFGWQPKHSDLKTIVNSAWLWHSLHPKGFES